MRFVLLLTRVWRRWPGAAAWSAAVRNRMRLIAGIALLACWGASGCCWAQAATPQSPPAQQSPATMPAQAPPAAPPQTSGGAHRLTMPQNPSVVITLDQAIELAKKNNPSLQAQRTQIMQNKEQEVTANLRPNPALSWDAEYLPIFDPHLFSSEYMDNTAEFDAGLGYLFERGQKRQHRLQAAKDFTSVTESQVLDAERDVVADTGQQFVAVLLAKSNYEFAEQLLKTYQQTVGVSQEQQKAGAISKSDLLKIQLQTLQFQTDVTTAKIAVLQALNSLRQLLGFDSVPRDYDVSGSLAYEPINLTVDDLRARALNNRPDLQAAERSITAAQSQIGLAKANSKQDLNATFDYSHVNASNLAAFYFSIPLPIFNRNQGEVARTYYALTQSKFLAEAARQQVLTDVKNGYENLLSSEEVIELYNGGYLQQAKQSLEIAQFAYQHGAASLLDFLDAERSYRATELSYRQSVAAYMSALEQLRAAVGTRDLR
ncbi:MAG: TolC family protein [Candidatus Korobacteraceae bacterium]